MASLGLESLYLKRGSTSELTWLANEYSALHWCISQYYLCLLSPFGAWISGIFQSRSLDVAWTSRGCFPCRFSTNNKIYESPSSDRWTRILNAGQLYLDQNMFWCLLYIAEGYFTQIRLKLKCSTCLLKSFTLLLSFNAVWSQSNHLLTNWTFTGH